jgi:hypothetical protein
MRKIFFGFLLLCSAILIVGCSVLQFAEFYKQARPVTWKILSFDEDRVYAYSTEFDSTSLRVRTLDAGSWGMFGPPLVPIIPLPRSSWFSDSLTIYFDIQAMTSAESLQVQFPSIAIRLDSAIQLVSPADSFLVQASISRIRDEGLYHWEFRAFSQKPLLNYMYKFRIKKYPRSTLEVVFLEPYFGHVIPPIKYIRTSEVHYKPILLPHGA